MSIDAPPIARRDTSVSPLRSYDRCHYPGHAGGQADVVVKDSPFCCEHGVIRFVGLLNGLPWADRYHEVESYHEDVPEIVRPEGGPAREPSSGRALRGSW